MSLFIRIFLSDNRLQQVWNNSVKIASKLVENLYKELCQSYNVNYISLLYFRLWFLFQSNHINSNQKSNIFSIIWLFRHIVVEVREFLKQIKLFSYFLRIVKLRMLKKLCCIEQNKCSRKMCLKNMSGVIDIWLSFIV